MDMMQEVVFILNEIILVASALLSITGLTLLCNIRQPKKNHIILLRNFSCIELFHVLSKFIVFLSIQTAGLGSIYRTTTEIVARASWFSYYLMMMLLLFERLVACIYPLRYKVTFSQRKAITACLMPWVIGLSTAITCPVVGFQEFRVKTQQAYLGFDIGFLSASCLVYIAIGLKLRNQMPSNRNTGHGNLSKVAFLIVGTFLFFVAIPNIIAFFIAKGNEDTLTNAWVGLIYVFGNINFCVDPLIYVFGYQPVKVLLKQKIPKLCCFMVSVNQVNSVQLDSQTTQTSTS